MILRKHYDEALKTWLEQAHSTIGEIRVDRNRKKYIFVDHYKVLLPENLQSIRLFTDYINNDWEL